MYPYNWGLRLIRMYIKPSFREDQNNIRLIRISPYSYYFFSVPGFKLGVFNCTRIVFLVFGLVIACIGSLIVTGPVSDSNPDGAHNERVLV